MESLRKQLSDTQGALTEKVLQVRQLRADHAKALNVWTQEKQGFEAKLQRLEAEIQQIRQTDKTKVQNNSQLLIDLEDEWQGGRNSLSWIALTDDGVGKTPEAQGGDEEMVTITRSQMQEVETKYKTVTDELVVKTQQCEALQRQLEAQGSNGIRTSYPSDLSEDIVTTRWEKLKIQIRMLSLERFNTPTQPKLVSDKGKKEFEHLSTHWKSYLSNARLTSYIFRALIWRYLYTTLFVKYYRVWGRERGDAAASMEALFEDKVSQVEAQDWRVLTAKMFHRACQADSTVASDVINRILEATAPFASGANKETLKSRLTEIVDAAVDISTIVARSRLSVLMSDKPGSELTRGFPYQEATMEMKGKLGTSAIVDLMVTPCLLKKEVDYSIVAKAEVIC